MSDTSGHTHQDLEDRLTAEMAMVRTEIGALGGRIDVLERDVAGLRVEMHRGFAELRGELHRGFAAIGQAIEQILARLPEPPI